MLTEEDYALHSSLTKEPFSEAQGKLGSLVPYPLHQAFKCVLEKSGINDSKFPVISDPFLLHLLQQQLPHRK